MKVQTLCYEYVQYLVIRKYFVCDNGTQGKEGWKALL